MAEIDFLYVRDFILNQLKLIGPKLGSDSHEAILHYVHYAEYEMAFEGMFIDLMKLKEKPNIDFKECMIVAKLLKLNEETMFDMNFWPKFEAYIGDM